MAQTRRDDPVEPGDGRSTAQVHGGPRTPRRPPAAVLVVAAVLLLQALALLWLAGDAIAHAGEGVLPVGARVMLILIYVLLGVWILAAASAMLRGRAWSRGAATAVQLFGVLLSSWLFSVGAPVAGGALIAVSGVALVIVFSRSVTGHVTPAAADPGHR